MRVSTTGPDHCPAAPAGSPTTAALLVTADPLLAAQVQRLAAAAGASLEVVAAAEDAGRSWSRVAAVLVGADQLDAASGLRLPARPRLSVLVAETAPDRLFRVAVDLGAAAVLELPAASGRLTEVLAEAAEAPAVGAVAVAVVGGSGGVGASVLAAALAQTAARSARALLVDLDPLGPGLHRLVGPEHPTGSGWPDLATSVGRLGTRALADALPRHGELALLGWPGTAAPSAPSAPVVREALAAGRRGHRVVVVDLPRQPASVTAALDHCQQVVLLVRPTVASVAAAARVAASLHLEPDGAGVAVAAGPGAGAPDVAAALGLPLLGRVPHDRRLDEHLRHGLGPVPAPRAPLARACADLLRMLGAAA